MATQGTTKTAARVNDGRPKENGRATEVTQRATRTATLAVTPRHHSSVKKVREVARIQTKMGSDKQEINNEMIRLGETENA